MKAPLRAIRDPCTMARRRAIAEIVATAATVDAIAADGHHAGTKPFFRPEAPAPPADNACSVPPKLVVCALHRGKPAAAP